MQPRWGWGLMCFPYQGFGLRPQPFASRCISVGDGDPCRAIPVWDDVTGRVQSRWGYGWSRSATPLGLGFNVFSLPGFRPAASTLCFEMHLRWRCVPAITLEMRAGDHVGDACRRSRWRCVPAITLEMRIRLRTIPEGDTFQSEGMRPQAESLESGDQRLLQPQRGCMPHSTTDSCPAREAQVTVFSSRSKTRQGGSSPIW
jgi:hypothetical protein